ncbi:MAG: hypothetical protein ACRECH_00185 [Nitrososphaerales archaeon]
MQRVNIFTPIHKAVRSVIYKLGRELQTVDFSDERATKGIADMMEHDLSLATSTCILCLLHEHAGNDRYMFPRVSRFEPEMVETLIQEHGEVVTRLARVCRSY